MYWFLLAFFDVCRLRRGPQDIPASQLLFAIAMGGYILAGVGLTAIDQPLRVALLAGLAEPVALAVLSYAALFLIDKTARWLQTVTALAGTGLVFSLISAPLVVLLALADAGTGARSLVYLLSFAVLCWNVVVIAHILRHALSISFAAGVLVALGFVWLITVSLAPLFPAQAGL